MCYVGVCVCVDWLWDGLFSTEELCLCVCVCLCVPLCVCVREWRGWDSLKRYQRSSSQPHSCINIHQVIFQTESHSSLSTVQGINKNRQKATRSLLTMRTALGLTKEEIVRPSSDVYVLTWRKCIFSVLASLLSGADGAFIREKRLFFWSMRGTRHTPQTPTSMATQWRNSREGAFEEQHQLMNSKAFTQTIFSPKIYHLSFLWLPHYSVGTLCSG